MRNAGTAAAKIRLQEGRIAQKLRDLRWRQHVESRQDNLTKRRNWAGNPSQQTSPRARVRANQSQQSEGPVSALTTAVATRFVPATGMAS